MSVATKIGIQINAKLGGEIWSVTISTKTLMVIGMDSYHDSKRRGASVGAFVASTNPTQTRFYSRIIYQRTVQELMDGLAICMKDALQEYHRNNNCLPEKIVLYRDGVSDGQLSVVAEHELPQIVDTFPKIMPNYQPKLAVIIVKKRGNARFFQVNGRTISNPAPYYNWNGTIRVPAVCQYAHKLSFLVEQSFQQDFNISLADKLFYL